MPVVPMTLTMSATTADAVSSPPAPGPSSVISRIASPCSMTALNGPSTAASGWCARRRTPAATRTSTAPSTSVAEPISRTAMPSSRAAATCVGPIRSMPVVRHVVERDARAERDRREDRHLRGRVGAVHVLGRVGLRVAEPLRLGERLAS